METGEVGEDDLLAPPGPGPGGQGGLAPEEGWPVEEGLPEEEGGSMPRPSLADPDLIFVVVVVFIVFIDVFVFVFLGGVTKETSDSASDSPKISSS